MYLGTYVPALKVTQYIRLHKYLLCTDLVLPLQSYTNSELAIYISYTQLLPLRIEQYLDYLDVKTTA